MSVKRHKSFSADEKDFSRSILEEKQDEVHHHYHHRQHKTRLTLNQRETQPRRGGRSSSSKCSCCGGSAACGKKVILRIILGGIFCLSIIGMIFLHGDDNTNTSTTILRRHSTIPLPYYDCQGDLQQLVTAYLDDTTPRGIILPLFDGIATLGASLIKELRQVYQVNLPIEIPHCGDLAYKYQVLLTQMDPNIILYDVCKRAIHSELSSSVQSLKKSSSNCFCKSLDDCHRRYRNFDIKLLAVTLSQFKEIMLLDADTLFFQSPMDLWNLQMYQETGTLFFHDRISSEKEFLAEKKKKKKHSSLTALQNYLTKDIVPFLLQPFQHLNTVQRFPLNDFKYTNNKTFAFHPSEFLLKSHSWNERAGHQMDSSVVLWHKTKQARASSLLTSFLLLHHGLPRPPSYGDKELFFIACEIAETKYSFSHWGVGSIGNTPTKNHTVLCGQAIHYYPSSLKKKNQLFYMNSDDILKYNLQKPLYRTIERPANFYAGSFTERKLPQECPFDVQIVQLTEEETKVIQKRQLFHQEILQHLNSTKM